MAPIGTTGRLLLVSFAGLAMAAACKKEASPTTTAFGPVEPVIAPPAKAVRSSPMRATEPDHSAAGLLRYLPRDSSAVVGINWRKLRKSEVVRSYDAKITAAIPMLGDTKLKCGLDPLTDIHSVAVGLAQDAADDELMVVALIGNFTRDAVESCIRAHGGKIEGDRYNSEVNVYWPADDAVVISKGQSAEQLALFPSASAWDSDKLMVLVDELDLHAGLWIAGTLPATLASTLAAMGATPWGGYAFFDIGSGLNATIALNYTEEADAKSALAMANMGLGMAKNQAPLATLLSSVNVGVVGHGLVVMADFSADQLSQLQTFIQQAGF